MLLGDDQLKMAMIRRVLFCLVLMVFLSITIGWAAQSTSGLSDTMLMFVGEDLEVLTLASRREERAWDAPAIVSVVTRNQILTNRFLTMNEALSTLPGFYMEKNEAGTQPYLRGLANSVLFLYDTIPTGSDASKTLHQLDGNLSLTSVKRIEVIRGAGSVLWGADAFCGIVNCVPLAGEDVNGVETGILWGPQEEAAGFYVNSGFKKRDLDLFLSISGREEKEDTPDANIVTLWGDEGPKAPSERFGTLPIDSSQFLEVTGSVDYGRIVRLSGRVSDSCQPYMLTDPGETYRWIEQTRMNTGHVRIETRKLMFGKSAIRLSGALSWLRPQFKIINKTYRQKEETSFAEIIYDRAFFSETGIFTAGIYYRTKQVENAPASESYLPDYLSEKNTNLLPDITEGDYKAHLWSLFSQYHQKIGDVDVFAGLRHDNHDIYEDHSSFSSGILWKPMPAWMLKVLYGTAYRTPFSFHVLDSPSFSGSLYEEGEKPDLEKIGNMSLQIAYKPHSKMKFSLCGFRNQISNHIVADRYAGLSLPGSTDIEGIEAEATVSLADWVDLSSNLTVLSEVEDGEITYNLEEGVIYIRPDGTLEKLDDVMISHANIIGPDLLANVMLHFSWTERFSWSLIGNYTSSRKILVLQADKNRWDRETLSGHWGIHANLIVKRVLWGVDLNVHVRNLLDTDYRSPGIYSSIDGEPFTMELMLIKKW